MTLLGPDARFCRRAMSGEAGVSLPPFIDHHVHLHLIDERQLAPHGIAAVVDLGGDPVALARRSSDGFPPDLVRRRVPDRSRGLSRGQVVGTGAIIHEVSNASTHPGVPGGVVTAVDEQVACGASVIKVALNRDAGPVFDLGTLSAIVSSARARDLPVVAHVEGEEMMRLALDAAVDALAHAPFSEWLDGASIARARAIGQRWISTLSIHDAIDAERAAINLATFAAAGGRVLYGTDLGNGERPSGIQHDELRSLDAAGVRGAALIAALVDPWPLTESPTGVSTFVPGDPPADLDAVPAWLAGATVVPTEELIHDDLS